MSSHFSDVASDCSGEDWERLYQQSKHLSVWPWSDVVSLCVRFANIKDGIRVLELGCGAGANIPFFRSVNAEYWTIEASPTAVSRLRGQYPDLKERLVVGDFANAFDAPGRFDLILDRASVTHNGTSRIRRILSMIEERLAPGGRFVGIDWFSTEFTEYVRSVPTEDCYTRTGFSGRLSGIDLAHFCDRLHLDDLLAPFTLLYLEHKSYKVHIPASDECYSSWNFVASLK